MILSRRIVAHFEHLSTLDRWPFFWRVTLEGFAVPWLFVFVGGLFIKYPTLPRLQNLEIGRYLLLALLLGPIWELFLTTAIPTEIARRRKLGIWWQVFIALPIFWAPHILNGVRSAISAVPGGFYLIFTFVVWRRRSFWTGAWMNWSSHVVHNAAAVAIWWYFPPN